jgi:uracil-DNA glycosylase
MAHLLTGYGTVKTCLNWHDILMTLAEPSLARDFEAALAWWRSAGVDCDFGDDATAWLAASPLETPATGLNTSSPATGRAATAPERQAQPAQNRAAVSAPPQPSPPPTERRNLLGDSPPQDLAAFRDWWLAAPELDTAGLYPRIAPRGPANAALMVLVPQPEEHDRESLLEGPQGRLLANMLAAMGLDAEGIYLASALPCHTPMADLAAIGAGGMDAVLAHHIALAKPQRLLVLGTGLTPFLTPVKDEILRKSNQAVVNTPTMVSETLEAMLHMPRLKARFWRRWMEWSAPQ